VHIVEAYFEKATVLKELEFVRSAIETRVTIPVLSHVLLEAVGNELRISATDTELGARSKLPAKVKEEGALVIPGLRFLQIVRSAPDGEIHCKRLENHWAQIGFGRSSFKLMGLSKESFPAFPTGAKPLANIDAPLLAGCVAKTHFSASQDTNRVALAGAKLVLRKAGLTMVATDGHRLSCIEQACDFSELPQEESLLIPRKALLCLQSLALEKTQPRSITVAKTDTYVFFVRGSRGIFSRMLTGQFPAYEKALPTGHPCTIKLARVAFEEMVRRVKLMSDDQVHKVNLTLQGNSLELSTNSSQVGEAKDSLPIDYAQEPIQVSFNAGYVQEFLDATSDAESITIQLKDATSAVEFRLLTEQPANYRYVVMPLRS